jgi:hypothetical protein
MHEVRRPLGELYQQLRNSLKRPGRVGREIPEQHGHCRADLRRQIVKLGVGFEPAYDGRIHYRTQHSYGKKFWKGHDVSGAGFKSKPTIEHVVQGGGDYEADRAGDDCMSSAHFHQQGEDGVLDGGGVGAGTDEPAELPEPLVHVFDGPIALNLICHRPTVNHSRRRDESSRLAGAMFSHERYPKMGKGNPGRFSAHVAAAGSLHGYSTIGLWLPSRDRHLI